MTAKKVAIASVTQGYELKRAIHQHLEEQGHTVLDLGCHDSKTFVGYPSVGEAVAHALRTGDAHLGVVCCNYGTNGCAGVAKFQGVSAISCESVKTAEAARKASGANVLCMGASVVSAELANEIVDVFIDAEFLDLEGVPEKVRDFRRRARDQLVGLGVAPR